MKNVKNVLHNKIKEEFLAYFMMIYIERELTEDINSDSIIDEFFSLNIEGCNLIMNLFLLSLYFYVLLNLFFNILNNIFYC
jgi:hypothetical protein